MNSKQQILLNKIEYLFKFFYIVGVLVVLALLDNAGKDYIISSFMVFMLIYLFFGLSIPQAFLNLAKPRFQKQQFKNAKAVFKSTLLYLVITEGIVMTIAFIFVNKMSSFLHVEKAFPYGIMLFLPLLLLVPLNEVFRNYYQCYNRRLTVIITRVLGFVTALIVGICIYNPLKEYGLKVDALLKSEYMTELYASLTIPIAILASQVMVLLCMGWMYLVYKPYIRKQTMNDLTKYNETVFGMLPVIAKSHIGANVYRISIYLLVFAAFIFCSFYNRKTFGLEDANTSFGILAIVLCITILIPYFVTKAFSLKYILKYRKMLKNEDSRGVKAYLWNRTHKYFIITFALTIFFVVMSESIIYILTGTTTAQYVVHMQILSFAFTLVPLYSLYGMFLNNIGKSKSVLIINYVSLFLSVAVTFLLYKIPAIGGYGISVGIICYFLVAFLCEFFVLQRESGFNNNITKLLVLPMLGTFITGIILLILAKIIGIVPHRLLQLLICVGLLLLCVIIYMILLLVIHCVEEEDLNGGFWGRIMYKLGEVLHIF